MAGTVRCIGLCFTESWKDRVVSGGAFSRRIGSVVFSRISIVRVLGQEDLVLVIGAHISRELGARRLSTRTCRGNDQSNV